MVTCVAEGCNNKKRPGVNTDVTFHTFPKDKERRKKWLKALGKPNWLPTPYSVLCSEHFRPEDIDRISYSCVMLRKSAVPCIFKEQLPNQSVYNSFGSEGNIQEHDEGNMGMSEYEVQENSQEYLICLIEAYPILYDPSDPDYGNKLKVAETWQIISDVVNLPVEDCQAEWEMLLSKYKKHASVIHEYEANGWKAKSTWPLYDTFYCIEKQLQSAQDKKKPNEYKLWVEGLLNETKPPKRPNLQDDTAEDSVVESKKDFASNFNRFEMNPELPSKKSTLKRNGENMSEYIFIRDGENTSQTQPMITDINEDVQFVSSLLPALVRMKRKKNAMCKAELMMTVSKYQRNSKL